MFDYSSIRGDDSEYGRKLKLEIGDVVEFTVKTLKTVDSTNLNGQPEKAQVLEGVDADGDISYWPKWRLLEQMKAANVQANDTIRLTRMPDGSGTRKKDGRPFNFHDIRLEVVSRGSVADTVTSGAETTFSGLA